jgi:hypothetical protein
MQQAGIEFQTLLSTQRKQNRAFFTKVTVHPPEIGAKHYRIDSAY